MTTLTRESMTAAMEQAVQIRGADWLYPIRDPEWTDPTYETCVYALPSGEPACIIGLALHLQGVDVTKLPNIDAGQLIQEHLDYDGDREMMGSALSSAQFQQDRGRSWGSALECYQILLEGR